MPTLLQVDSLHSIDRSSWKPVSLPRLIHQASKLFGIVFKIASCFWVSQVVQVLQAVFGAKTAKAKEKPRILAIRGLSWDLPDLNREPAGYESEALTD